MKIVLSPQPTDIHQMISGQIDIIKLQSSLISVLDPSGVSIPSFARPKDIQEFHQFCGLWHHLYRLLYSLCAIATRGCNRFAKRSGCRSLSHKSGRLALTQTCNRFPHNLPFSYIAFSPRSIDWPGLRRW